MKIIFEVGDIVNIEDNMDAGEIAACEGCTLIKKLPNKKWLVRNDVDTFGPNGDFIVEEQYLLP